MNGSQLGFAPESEVSVTGGDVSLTGTETQKAVLAVEGGRIRITAVGEKAGEVPITGKADFEMEGELLMESARIESSGNGGGDILIQAGTMKADGSVIAAYNTGSEYAQDSADPDINGRFLFFRDSQIQSNGSDEGNTERIRIASNAGSDPQRDAGSTEVTVAGMLEMSNGAQISSATLSEGNANNVMIQAGLLDLNNGAVVGSITVSEGKAGNVTVKAGEIRIQGMEGQVTGIMSQANSGSQGDAGSVEVTADGMLEMISGAVISSATFSQGKAGSVTIHAGDIRIDGQGMEGQLTGIVSLATMMAEGHVGSVEISANTVTLQNGGQINIQARQTLSEERLADTPEATIRISANTLHLDQDAVITSESSENVPAAPIYLKADKLMVEDNS